MGVTLAQYNGKEYDTRGDGDKVISLLTYEKEDGFTKYNELVYIKEVQLKKCSKVTSYTFYLILDQERIDFDCFTDNSGTKFIHLVERGKYSSDPKLKKYGFLKYDIEDDKYCLCWYHFTIEYNEFLNTKHDFEYEVSEYNGINKNSSNRKCTLDEILCILSKKIYL